MGTYQRWKLVYIENPPPFFDALIPGAPPGYYKIKIKPSTDTSKKGVTMYVASASLQEPTDEEIRKHSAEYIIEMYDYPHLVVGLNSNGAKIHYSNIHYSDDKNNHFGWKEVSQQKKMYPSSCYFESKQLKDMGFTDFMVVLLYQEFLWLDMLKALSK